MENLNYNLSEEDFSKRGKILLWGFAALFFLAGAYILFVSLVLGHKSIPAILSAAPLGISLVVSVIAAFASFKGAGQYFIIDNDKIEYKFGVFHPETHTYLWKDVKEMVMARRQNKVMLILVNGSKVKINLNWVQGRKSGDIRKHLFHAARERDLNVRKVNTLSGI